MDPLLFSVKELVKSVLSFNNIEDDSVVVDDISCSTSLKMNFLIGFLVDGNDMLGIASVVIFEGGKEELEAGIGDSAGRVFKITLKSTLSGSWVDITKICSKSESSTEI